MANELSILIKATLSDDTNDIQRLNKQVDEIAKKLNSIVLTVGINPKNISDVTKQLNGVNSAIDNVAKNQAKQAENATKENQKEKKSVDELTKSYKIQNEQVRRNAEGKKKSEKRVYTDETGTHKRTISLTSKGKVSGYTDSVDFKTVEKNVNKLDDLLNNLKAKQFSILSKTGGLTDDKAIERVNKKYQDQINTLERIQKTKNYLSKEELKNHNTIVSGIEAQLKLEKRAEGIAIKRLELQNKLDALKGKGIDDKLTSTQGKINNVDFSTSKKEFALLNQDLKQLKDSLPPTVKASQQLNNEQAQLTQILKQRNKLNQGQKGIFSDSQLQHLNSKYDDVIKTLNQLINTSKKLSDDEAKNIRDQIKHIENLKKEYQGLENQKKKNTSTSSNQKELSYSENILKQIEAEKNKLLKGSKGLFSDQQIGHLTKEYDGIIGKLQNIIKTNQKLSEGEINNIKGRMEFIDKLQRKYQGLEEQQKKTTKQTTPKDFDLELAKKQLTSDTYKLSDKFGSKADKKALEEIRTELEKLPKPTADNIKKFEDLKTKFKHLSAEAEIAAKSAYRLSDMIGLAAKKVAVWAISTNLIYGSLHAFQLVLDQIVQIDARLTELSKVLSSSTNFDQLMKDTVNIANTYGRSLTEAQDSLIEIGKAGYEAEDAITLLNASLLGSNVTGLKTAQMTEYMTSALIAYNMSVEQATQYVDKLNEVDNNFAVTSIGLAQSLAKSAETAQQFGVSIDQLIGLTTGVASVTRESGNQIGNSWKTMLARLNMDVAQDALATIGVTVKDVNGELRSGFDVYEEVAMKWDGMTRAERTYIAEALAI